MLGENQEQSVSTGRMHTGEYAIGWNDAIERCAERMDNLAALIDSAGQAPIARAVRRIAAEFRGTAGGRGRPPRTGG